MTINSDLLQLKQLNGMEILIYFIFKTIKCDRSTWPARRKVDRSTPKSVRTLSVDRPLFRALWWCPLQVSSSNCPSHSTRRDVTENTQSAPGSRQQHKTSTRVSVLARNASRNQGEMLIMWTVCPVPKWVTARTNAIPWDTHQTVVQNKCRPISAGWKQLPRYGRPLQRLLWTRPPLQEHISQHSYPSHAKAICSTWNSRRVHNQ